MAITSKSVFIQDEENPIDFWLFDEKLLSSGLIYSGAGEADGKSTLRVDASELFDALDRQGKAFSENITDPKRSFVSHRDNAILVLYTPPHMGPEAALRQAWKQLVLEVLSKSGLENSRKIAEVVASRLRPSIISACPGGEAEELLEDKGRLIVPSNVAKGLITEAERFVRSRSQGSYVSILIADNAASNLKGRLETEPWYRKNSVRVFSLVDSMVERLVHPSFAETPVLVLGPNAEQGPYGALFSQRKLVYGLSEKEHKALEGWRQARNAAGERLALSGKSNDLIKRAAFLVSSFVQRVQKDTSQENVILVPALTQFGDMTIDLMQKALTDLGNTFPSGVTLLDPLHTAAEDVARSALSGAFHVPGWMQIDATEIDFKEILKEAYTGDASEDMSRALIKAVVDVSTLNRLYSESLRL